MKQRDKINLRMCFIVACTIQGFKGKRVKNIFNSNLLDFLPNDKRVFFPYFLSGISLVIEATAVNIWVSVDAAKQVSAPAVEACHGNKS